MLERSDRELQTAAEWVLGEDPAWHVWPARGPGRVMALFDTELIP